VLHTSQIKEVQLADIKSEISIIKKLQDAKNELSDIWKQIMPLRPDAYDQPYAIDHLTINALFAEEKDPSVKKKVKLNPFFLSIKQHYHLGIVLSLMIQISDDLLDGFKIPKPTTRESTWRPLQYREELCYARVNFSKFKKKWEMEINDIPIHLENHVRIMGNFSGSDKEHIVRTIQPGAERAYSILSTLVKPFIDGFKNVAEAGPIYMQKFCDKLEPSSDITCCIDARTRQALDYALQVDLVTETFSEIMNHVIAACPVAQNDSYFFLLAILIKKFWGVKYKKDEGIYGIAKEAGTISLDKYPIILDGFKKVTYDLTINNDFLHAHKFIPDALKLIYFQFAIKQTVHLTSFQVVDEADYVALNELIQSDYLGKNFFHLLSDFGAVEIARRCINNADKFLLLYIKDLWQDPLREFLVEVLQSEDLYKALNIFNWYFSKENSVKNIIGNIFEISFLLSNIQLIEAIQYINLFAKIYEFCPQHLTFAIQELQDFLGYASVFKLLSRSNILFPIMKNLTSANKQNLQTFFKVVSKIDLSIQENAECQMLIDQMLLLQIMHSSSNLKTNILGFLLVESELIEPHTYLNQISPNKLYQAIHESHITTVPLFVTFIILERMRNEPVDTLLNILILINPFSTVTLDKLALLLDKVLESLSAEQTIELLTRAHLIKKNIRNQPQQLQVFFSILTHYFSSEQLLSLLKLDKLYLEIFIRNTGEAESLRQTRIRNLLGMLITDETCLTDLSQITIKAISFEQKQYTANLLGYFILMYDFRDVIICTSFIQKLTTQALKQLIQNIGEVNVPIHFNILLPLIRNLDSKDIYGFYKKEINSIFILSNSNFVNILAEIFNKIPEAQIKIILQDLPRTKFDLLKTSFSDPTTYILCKPAVVKIILQLVTIADEKSIHKPKPLLLPQSKTLISATKINWNLPSELKFDKNNECASSKNKVVSESQSFGMLSLFSSKDKPESNSIPNELSYTLKRYR
jgi:hypothetical protein